MGGKGKGIKQRKSHRQSGDYQRERGVGEAEESKGGIDGDGRRFDLGWCAHNTIYR